MRPIKKLVAWEKEQNQKMEALFNNMMKLRLKELTQLNEK